MKRRIIEQMHLKTSTRFFRNGYGKAKHHRGPTVHAWLLGIPSGYDLLKGSVRDLSDAMGKHTIKSHGKNKGLVRFELRGDSATHGNRSIPASQWGTYAKKLFDSAKAKRRRPSGKGQTGLK